MSVVEVTEESFEREVVERSDNVPVVVDFWAPWCAPCRALGPVLEQAAAEHEGAIVLAKVDTDANPGLSQRFGIQGIPAVKAFSHGDVVDEFVGAAPAAAVRRFFDGLLPSPAQGLVDAGDEQSLRGALELEPGRADAAVALARMLHGRGEDREALELLETVTGGFQAQGLAARIRLTASGLAPESRVERGLSALDGGELERGVELLLEALVRQEAPGDQLRQVIVAALEQLGVEHPAAREARRRLAAALY